MPRSRWSGAWPGRSPAQAPRATLRLTPLTGGDAAEQLDRGAIDVAVAHLRALPAHIELTVLLRDPFVVVARARPSGRRRAPLSIEAYAALEPRAGVAARRYQRRARPHPRGFRVERRIALLVATYLAVPAALAASDLVATVPRRVARQIAANAEIAIMPLPIDFAATVSMAWHRRAASEPAQAWFRSLLIDAATIHATPNGSDTRE